MVRHFQITYYWKLESNGKQPIEIISTRTPFDMVQRSNENLSSIQFFSCSLHFTLFLLVTFFFSAFNLIPSVTYMWVPHTHLIIQMNCELDVYVGKASVSVYFNRENKHSHIHTQTHVKSVLIEIELCSRHENYRVLFEIGKCVCLFFLCLSYPNDSAN